MPLVALTNLHKHYTVGGVSHTVLHDISLTVNRGEMIAIIGASGSGKSTLMNIIGLLDKADSGRYLLQRRLIDTLSSDALAKLRNQHIGFVFQHFNLLPRFTAEQNVALPLLYRGLSARETRAHVFEALDQLGMLSFANYHPTQLSGGQQQRIAIARALITNPAIILADEPTGALDSATGNDIMSLFHDLHDKGRTVLLITHDERIAMQCKRCITLADGQIKSDLSL